MRQRLARFYDEWTYTPKRCRYDPNEKFEFSMSLNLLFGMIACPASAPLHGKDFSFEGIADRSIVGFASTFTVANLYYNHPILNKLAVSFNVTDEQASYIPTLSQAGYAGGLLLLCPLGDLVKRRAFVLWLVWFTATIW